MNDSKKWKFMIAAIVILTALTVTQGIVLFKVSSDNQKLALTQNRHMTARIPAAESQAKLSRFHAQPHGVFSPGSDFGDPFEEMALMQRSMDRMMNRMFQHGSGWGFQPMADQWLAATFSPSADFEDAGDKWVARFDVPGLDKDKIQVEVRNGVLTVQGERKSEAKSEDQARGFYSSEIHYGSFARSIALPASADESNIQASYDKGVLVVTIGKKPEAQKAISQIPVR